MKEFSYLQNVATLTLDAEKCIGCGRCVEVCPHCVFVFLGHQIVIENFNACMECGACMVNCPAEAIFVDAGVGCAAGIVTQWWRDFTAGSKKAK